jgi:hypothetical protein
MNDAVYKFKRYEDSSLIYTGINKHEGEKVGLFDTVISNQDYKNLFILQQGSLAAPKPSADDVPDKPYYVDITDEEEEDDLTLEPAKLSPSSRGEKTTDVHVSQTPAFSTTLAAPTSTIEPVTPSPAKQEEPPKIVYSGVKIGSALTHKKFGPGKVVSIKGGLMTVVFAEGKKMFQFPQAIENGFFTID